MVKEKLLRVAGIRAEMLRSKFLNLFRRAPTLPREIQLVQHPFDPHIDRKRRQAFAGK